MTDQDYADFCNFAYRLGSIARRAFSRKSDEEIYELNGYVRHQQSHTASGRVNPDYDFLAAILAEEAEDRRNPPPPVGAKVGGDDDLPF